MDFVHGFGSLARRHSPQKRRSIPLCKMSNARQGINVLGVVSIHPSLAVSESAMLVDHDPQPTNDERLACWGWENV
jgi:hypothetical protein